MPSTVSIGMQPATQVNRGAELAALLSRAGVAPLEDLGWIRVTGSDRVRWLNGMVTNSIQDLSRGKGCYCFVLNVQGRIQGDLTAFLEDDAILLRSDKARLPGLIGLLDRFIIMDDVVLEDVSAERTGLVVAGSGAAALLEAIELPANSISPVQMQTVEWRGLQLWLVSEFSPLVPRFELWADAAVMGQVAEALAGAGAVQMSAGALEQLRVLEGTPRYGTDIRERDLPQETGQTRALHFSKGCYLGQEIVERIRSRGQVHRTLSGFELSGEMPPAGSPLEADGKAVGELTSVEAIEHPVAGRIQLALGYVRREAVERALPLTYPGGTASPVTLPYTRA